MKKLPSLEWLQHFMVLTQSGSFHQAAQLLGLTQQALSKSIRQLEAHLKVELFARQTHQLTSAGEQLLQQCNDILAALNQIQEAVTPSSEQALQIGIVHQLSAATHVYTDALYKQMRNDPDKECGIYILTWEAMYRLLQIGALDFGLTAHYTKESGVECVKIGSSPWVYVSARRDAPAKASIGLQDWWSSSPTPALWNGPEWTDAQFEISANTPRIALEMCLQQQGTLRIPELFVADALAAGQLFCLKEDVACPPYEVFVVWHLNNVFSLEKEAFLEHYLGRWPPISL